MITKGWISFSSPVWANMGTQRGLPISCFNVHIPDSIEGITHKMGEVIMQTKIGGGTSGYFGELRHRGTAVTDNGKSSGAVSFMKLFDTAMDVVSQGGFVVELSLHIWILTMVILKNSFLLKISEAQSRTCLPVFVCQITGCRI